MNELAITVAIIIFPGVIAAVICDKIIVHQPRWDHFKFGLYSFILGITCYIALQFLVNIVDLLLKIDENNSYNLLSIWKFFSESEEKLNLLEVFGATILSMPVALFASWIVNYKIFNKLSKKLRISNKYGDENLFSFYLNMDGLDWVYVRDIDNNITYQGKILSFSENDNIQEIVLSDVTVYSYTDSEEYYSVPSTYICKNMGTFIIEAIPQEILGVEYEQEADK